MHLDVSGDHRLAVLRKVSVRHRIAVEANGDWKPEAVEWPLAPDEILQLYSDRKTAPPRIPVAVEN